MSAELVPLGSLLTEIRNGLNCEQYETASNPSMLPISRIETISEGTVDFERVNYINVSPSGRNKYQLQLGDILFSHINSPNHIGKTAIFRSDHPLIHGVNLLLLRPNQAICHPEYLNYYLKSFGPRATFRSRCKKAVNQASLNHGDVTSLLVPHLSLPEQKRISAILGKADRLRRLRSYALELSNTYLQSVFLEMFGDPVVNPKGWDIDSLDRSIISTQNGYGKRSDFDVSGTIVLRIQDVAAGSIKYSKPRRMRMSSNDLSTYQLDNNDLLLIRVNGNPSLVGRAALFRSIDIPVAFSDHIIRVKLNDEIIDSVYLEKIVNSRYGRAQVQGSVRTTAGQYTINRSGLSMIFLPYPPLPHQKQFARIALKYERLQYQQREAERQAEHLFQTLLHKAFKGELN